MRNTSTSLFGTWSVLDEISGGTVESSKSLEKELLLGVVSEGKTLNGLSGMGSSSFDVLD